MCSYLDPVVASGMDGPEKLENLVFKDKKLIRATERLGGGNISRGVWQDSGQGGYPNSLPAEELYKSW